MKGRIIKYIEDRGFGFIKSTDEDVERFFHIKYPRPTLNLGAAVSRQ